MPDKQFISFRELIRNPVTVAGLVLALIATAIGLPMMGIDMLSHSGNPYLGILIYMVLPGLALLGLGLAVVGLWWTRRKHLRQPVAPTLVLPRIDFNDPVQQRWVFGLLTGFLVAGAILSVTGYRAYNFSDSVQFCGLTCHKVMKPEYTAYQHSPHARVACVECHVGPGASWFVRAKITGAYQIYAATFNKYPRPIPTPIKSLRPAQQTCEQCHWPAKFFGAQQKTFTHFQSDEKNTPWTIQLLLKIGGGDPNQGFASGIHWHMNIKNDIYYVATDEKREMIPWIRVIDKQGHVTEYMSTESPLSPQDLAKSTIRHMDCMDCHNRPSHIFYPPDRAVDKAFEAGRLDPTLPYLKREAVRLLSESYKSEDEARKSLKTGLADFYQAHYADLYRTKATAISQAEETLQQVFSENIFPEMHADWRVYPSHIGHLSWDGCFRCHDGLHKSQDGKVITNNCNTCHTIIAQGTPEQIRRSPLQAQTFRHPVDVGMDVTQMKCSQCHGVQAP